MTDFIFTGKAEAVVTILLAHGAGAPMDSDAMNAFAEGFAEVGFRVARFEFEYMAARRSTGKRAPPPRAEALVSEYKQAVVELGARNLIIGGKSMGGRVASMVVDELAGSYAINGLLCLGYPFHPVGKPEQTRTLHLETLKTPALICQGTRDAFGTRQEVDGYRLSEQIELLWLEDGDHDLKPRKSVSGYSFADHLATVTNRTREWATGFTQST